MGKDKPKDGDHQIEDDKRTPKGPRDIDPNDYKDGKKK